jgi:1-acyl-sn-glycerol-3-phosphate acyltransferase
MTPPITSAQPSKFRLYLGASLFLSIAILFTLLFAPVILVCIVCPFKVRYRIGRAWAKWVMKLAEWCFDLRHEVQGLENLAGVPAAVILSNHQSAWETVAFRFILPMQTALFKKSLLWIPFFGWALATMKPIAIDRSNKQQALRKLISTGTEALQSGLFVLTFPEGTRRPVGDTGKFSGGAAMLAQKSGFPVIPVAHNAGLFWPRYSFIKHPGVIKVKIGPPIAVEGKKAADINQEAEAWIKQALTEIGG